tara:strand:+ start:855 stop:1310 length:456 start_codon:yes stop_codon:yes gene_type:complete
MKKIFLNLIKRIRKFFFWLWEQEGSPSQRAVGFGLGVFSGCFPFFGFQTFIGIILAKIFKVNSVLAAVGTWISNPFTYVPLYFLNYRVGSFLLKTDNNIVDISHITTKDVWSQGWYFSSRLMTGSICVGLVSGVVCGICLYFSLKKLSNII